MKQIHAGWGLGGVMLLVAGCASGGAPPVSEISAGAERGTASLAAPLPDLDPRLDPRLIRTWIDAYLRVKDDPRISIQAWSSAHWNGFHLSEPSPIRLTPDEWRALADYKEAGFVRINTALSDGGAGALASVAREIAWLDRGIAAFKPLPRALVVFRGESRRPLRVGDLCRNTIYLSTSTQPDIGKLWALRSEVAGAPGALWSIHLPPGQHGARMSLLPRGNGEDPEEELLLPRGDWLRITEVGDFGPNAGLLRGIQRVMAHTVTGAPPRCQIPPGSRCCARR